LPNTEHCVRGLIITGALGAGKTTAQDALVHRHGFWTPVTITTRPVDVNEQYARYVSLEAFRDGVVEHKYVLPAKFGGQWYAWSALDFTRLTEDRASRIVVNVRPYTALLLSALIRDMLPVWLWVEPDELVRRVSQRSAKRDVDPYIGVQREHQDTEDKAYEMFFQYRVRSDENMLPSLLRLMESRP
jgi:guanylate kinase